MPPRPPLSAEERALWARVAATVRPFEPKNATALPPVRAEPVEAPSLPRAVEGRTALRHALDERGRRQPAPSADTLDGAWDRRLRRGLAAPGRAIDLHGHTLASAHGALEAALDRAVADDVRLLLVVTGRPPRGEGAARRGLIRAAIGDWLAASRHAGRIAAVRHAHPRHGGAGALYLVLRRRRG